MKKITFLMIALLAAVVTFAALLGKQAESPFTMLNKAEIVKAQKLIPAVKAIDRKAMPKRNGVKKAEAELVTPPETATVETYYTVDGGFYVGTSSGWSDYTSSMATVNVAVDGTDMYIQGLAYWFEDAWVKGTIDGATVTFPSGQLLGSDEYGDEFLVGSDDEETVTDIIFNYNSEEGILTAVTTYIFENGAQDALTIEEDDETYSAIYCIWYQPVFSTTEPEGPTLVEVPEGIEVLPYVMTYVDDEGKAGSVPVKVAVDGNDVYVQGFSNFLPEAWVKGVKDGNEVTFAEMQYVGEYYTYGSSYAFYNGDAVFTFDAETGTYTAEGLIFGVLANKYYDGYYVNPVLSPVVEKAAMPANPEVIGLTSTQYGYVVEFAVPTVDTNGDGLVTDKLAFTFYTDIEGEIAQLTFTPDTHTRLTESLTEIPYGFSESYDFYPTYIYLNELYSEDWNNIGIQSIYTGGDELNTTEIQWFHIKDYAAPAGGDVTFDFNKMDVATSSNVTQDGDINEYLTLTEGNVTLTISPKEESATTPNRFWGTSAGPQLRVYSGTLTFEVPEGSNITKIEFNAAKWNDGNSADSGEFDGTTWTGKAQKVVVSIAANTQINSIVVAVESEGGDEPIEPTEAIDPDGLTYDFEDGTPQGWTTIDADGDGYVWENMLGQVSAYKGSLGAMKSESYINNVGALTPDNYLVSPKFKLGAPIKFFACAQDASYPAEHFAVCVSTKGNKDADDFKVVQDWTLTAARADNFRAPRKVQGNWYEYTVDLSEYEGQEGYVAIRHYEVTDQFYMLVDDISFGKSAFEITPAEGIVESLDEFEITFNKFEVTASESGIAATLVNLDTEETWITNEVELENNILSFDMSEEGEITAPGTYALTVTGVMNGEEELELIFAYTIKEPLVLVELPEGVEAQEYTLSASGSTGESTLTTNATKLVAFDGTDVYLQGLAYYFPDAFVKGTLTEDGQVLVPSGQYVGTDKFGDEFLVALGTDEEGYLIDSESGVIAFDYDAESGELSLVEDTYYGESGTMDAEGLFNYFYSAIYTPGAFVLPDLVELPEGAEASNWYLTAYDSEDLFVNREVGVAIVDNDIYVQGMCDYLPEAWVKGTIDAEAGTATFATGQFYGTYYDTYNLFFLGFGEENVEDVVFTYDAENGVLTADNLIVLAGDQKGNQIFDYYYDVEISRDRPDSFPVEAPEDLVTETYLFTANVVTAGEDDDTSFARKAEADGVTFDFNAMDLATSSNDSTDGDITEALTLTEGDVTLTISPADEHYTNAANRFWGTNAGPQLRVYSGTLTVEAPEGSNLTQIVFNHNGKWGDTNSADSGELTNDADAKAATWTGEAQKVVITIGQYDEINEKYISGNSQINSIAVTVKGESGEEPDPEEPVVEKNYSYQIEVGFDGNDVYFSGINSDCAEYWMKGTLSEDGKTVTIPASQYMGGFSFWGYVFDYFITAMDEDGNMADIVLNYDAEKATFTTAQTVVLNGAKFDWDPYQTFTDVTITKMEDFAATPADPIFEAYDFEQSAGYNKIYASIPTVDVDGNELLTSKLFYTIWIEKDGKEQPYVFTAELYSLDFEEDMVEIPYNHDGYDIYKGGEIIYLEDDPAELATWTKVGIQSIYYGGGECNKSDIVWVENSVYEEDPVGIADVKTDSKNVVIFDLQGRRVAKTAKGLYIMDGKKVVIK